MSPHRQLSTSSHRHPSEIQDIFLGLGLQLHDDPPPEGTSGTPDEQREDARDMEYSMVLHDGTGVIESETYHYAFPGKGAGKEELNDASIRFSRVVLERILELQRVKSMDVSHPISTSDARERLIGTGQSGGWSSAHTRGAAS